MTDKYSPLIEALKPLTRKNFSISDMLKESPLTRPATILDALIMKSPIMAPITGELRPSILDTLATAATIGASSAPIVGDAISIKDTLESVANKEFVDAALNGLGILPIVPSLGIFAGKAAKTADLIKLEKAKEMKASGVFPDEITKETGWFQFPWSKEWRFEIPDQEAKISPKITNPNHTISGWGLRSSRTKNPGILEHKALLEAYPELSNLYQTNVDPIGSYYKPKSVDSSPLLNLSRLIQTPSKGKYEGIHEMQHAVQDIEGYFKFPGITASEIRRSAAKTGDYEKYNRLATEIEANLAAKRSLLPLTEIDPDPLFDLNHDLFTNFIKDY